MDSIREGVIHYGQAGFVFVPPLPRAEYAVLERYRRLLHRRRLIGVYADGLGYGNVSQRRDYSRLQATPRPQFLITGTQTGHLAELSGEHYVRVVDVDVERFAVSAQGAVRASSETVTHAAIYLHSPAIRAVIHVHHRAIWRGMAAGGFPATSRWIPYGTRELALAMHDCIGTASQGLIVLRGHEEGVIAYGPSLAAAMGRIDAVWRRFAGRAAATETAS